MGRSYIKIYSPTKEYCLWEYNLYIYFYGEPKYNMRYSIKKLPSYIKTYIEKELL